MIHPHTVIYIFRRDLRLSDNPIFHALTHGQSKHTSLLVPLYVLNPSQIELSGLLNENAPELNPFSPARSRIGKFWRTGPHRVKFLAESLWDLKHALRGVGNDLVVRAGRIEEILRGLVEAFRKEHPEEDIGVWLTRDCASEEMAEERDIKQSVSNLEYVQVRVFQDESSLIHRDDLLHKPRDTPDTYTSFRKPLEPLRDRIRSPILSPLSLPPLPTFLPSQTAPFTIPDTLLSLIRCLQKPLFQHPDVSIPTLKHDQPSSLHPFSGGASRAHARLNYLLDSGSASSYKDTRNGMTQIDDSTKLSAWLSLGCISAREVHEKLKEWEDTHNDERDNKGTYAIRFELLWRNYMRLCLEKYGDKFFSLHGFGPSSSAYSSNAPHWKHPPTSDASFQRFLRGTTHTGLVDASQRELLLTGWTSNRARQNVASYLAKRLQIDWRLGAEWYESMLVDFDVASNWGNWAYNAGVGNDPREDRTFNQVKQAHDYDPQGTYIMTWVEELRGISDVACVWQAWKLSNDEMKRRGIDRAPLVRINWNALGGKGNDHSKRGGRRGG